MMRALVAMSGGVDSAVAAALTQKLGYEAEGVTLKLHAEGGGAVCGSGSDADVAHAVAQKLGMPHTLLEKTEDFTRDVVGRFISTYERGDTPNPCIFCNRYLKFGTLFAEAASRGFDALVTGHYARIRKLRSGIYLLLRARAEEKDQSYVLYFLNQEKLPHLLFPLGEEESKTEVRKTAVAIGLSNAEKPDSQDICFVPDGDYAAFIARQTGKTYPKGNFIDTAGKVLGEHAGMLRYTVGQRKGLGIALGEPMYVKEKSAADNTVTLCRDAELYESDCTVREVETVFGKVGDLPRRVYAKVRYRAKAAPATLTVGQDGEVTLRFDEKVRAVTKGQAAVFYAHPDALPPEIADGYADGTLADVNPADILLGGGVIA